MQAPALGAPQPITQQTLRQIVHITLGGSQVRVRLSNVLGSAPLTIAAASVAVSTGGGAVAADTLRALSFGAERAITIPNGAEAISDPVALSVAASSDLAISLYIAQSAVPDTQLSRAHQTSYVSSAGDYTASATLPAASMSSAWFWLSGVEVQRPEGGRAVVAFGDSITEGYNSTPDTNARWPDVLARRLLACGYDLSVVNAAISGNHILADDGGANAQSRLDRDMLLQAGAHFVLLLEGINDLIVLGDAPDAPAQIIAGYRQIARRAHSRGLHIYAGTLLPAGAAPGRATGLEAGRQKINAWLRAENPFDGLVDFDAALRDPQQPTQLLPAFDSGDHLHPNDAGFQAMGNAVDLKLFSSAANEHMPDSCR